MLRIISDNGLAEGESKVARAAGTFTAKGIEICAKTVKVFMDDCLISYRYACDRVQITQDLIWSEEEHKAIKEAFEELYGAEK